MWQTLIPVLAALAGGMFGRSSSGSTGGATGTGALDPQMLEMLNEQRMRMRLQNPLYEEATQLARALMPRSAKPASYVLPGNVTTSPTPRRGEEPVPIPPRDPNGPQPEDGKSLNQAIRMMASGIRPVTQASLFRR